MHSEFFCDSTSGFITKSENLSASRLHGNVCELIYSEYNKVIYMKNAIQIGDHMPRFTKREYLLFKWYNYQHIHPLSLTGRQ